jgi:YVTN family beta-propeller protein
MVAAGRSPRELAARIFHRPLMNENLRVRRSFLSLVALLAACRAAPSADVTAADPHRLPTGQLLDPAGVVRPVGQMPFAMVPAPGARRLVLLLNGYRDQGVQVVDRAGRVTQTLPQEAAFVGLAFAPDGRTLYASGGNQDVVYRYRWAADSAVLADSLVLARKSKDSAGTRYPAGLAPSADGAALYVAENLADSLAVMDLGSGRVIQRVATGAYPYGVAVAHDGTVFVSNWGASVLSVFTRAADGHLVPADPIAAGRHPSALLLDDTRNRLYVASGSTDRVTVVDTRARRVIAELLDPPPGGVQEGSTPNALALSGDGTRLFVAEADANAVAVFDLSTATSGATSAGGADRLAGRIPAGWYPTALAVLGDTIVVGNGKGARTGPNPRGSIPGVARVRMGLTAAEATRQYTLGQLDGLLQLAPLARVSGAELDALSARVARANGWTDAPAARTHYPPFEHVIYVMRENRTYDQVLGDLPRADGDTSLLFFGRAVTPNAHALAERFGTYDRFFVNSEVSADGHNWSTAAYASDYTQKTTPTNYSGDGRSYDYEGENRNRVADDDAAEPSQGYLWDLARRAGITFRDFGEFTHDVPDGRGGREYRGTKPFVDANVDHSYPNFDMEIPDQRRMDIWLGQFRQWVAGGSMPALQIVLLPRDHTAGAAAGSNTPKAMVADNDLALGRLVEAVSNSPFWHSTVIFVLEDDAQNGPDHVDSHRSPLLVVSAWNRGGVIHRFANTTDVLCTIEEILGLGRLSQFDAFGRPLRESWTGAPDLRPYAALRPAQSLEERNPPRGRGALDSRRLDLAGADRADMELFNRVLWRAIKGETPYPGPRRMSALEAMRAR